MSFLKLETRNTITQHNTPKEISGKEIEVDGEGQPGLGEVLEERKTALKSSILHQPTKPDYKEEDIVISFRLDEKDVAELKKATSMFRHNGINTRIMMVNYWSFTSPNRRASNSLINFSVGVDEVRNHFEIKKEDTDTNKIIISCIDDTLKEHQYGFDTFEKESIGRGWVHPFAGGVYQYHTQIDLLEDNTKEGLLFQLSYRDLFRLTIQNYGIDIYKNTRTKDPKHKGYDPITQLPLRAMCYGENNKIFDLPVIGVVDWKDTPKHSSSPNREEIAEAFTREDWLNDFQIRSYKQKELYDEAVRTYDERKIVRDEGDAIIKKHTNGFTKDKPAGIRCRFSIKYLNWGSIDGIPDRDYLPDGTYKEEERIPEEEKILNPKYETKEEYAEYQKQEVEKYKKKYGTPWKWWPIDDYYDTGTSGNPRGWLEKGIGYYVKDEESYEKAIADTMERNNLTKDEVLLIQEKYKEFADFAETTHELIESENSGDFYERDFTNEEVKELMALEKQVRGIVKEQKKNRT